MSTTEVARALAIPRSTVRDWLSGRAPQKPRDLDGDQCRHPFAELPASYVYLLGLYLGDGCISTHPRGVFRMRIILDVRYPQIVEAAAEAISEVRGGVTHTLLRPDNCIQVSAYWKCWPCLFPQCGPGRKHSRRIALTNWQQALVRNRPDQLVRGLIHSDGCRFENSGSRNWRWPRYSFSQVSDDIRGIFCDACDELGIDWTASGERTIYVSRQADVARLEEFIGSKR